MRKKIAFFILRLTAASNFFWTASHAIGAHSSSRMQTPSHLQQTIRDDACQTPAPNDECDRTSVQQNMLPPSASHHSSLPISSILPPIEYVSIAESKPETVTTSTADATKSAPCNECGAAIA